MNVIVRVGSVALVAQRVDDLEDALKKKDDEMKQMEERYKKYLEKAKSVRQFFYTSRFHLS